MELSHILNTRNVADALTVAVSSVDRMATAATGRPAHVQKSWESLASFNNSNNAAEMITRIGALLHQLVWDLIQAEFINVALIIVWL